MTEIRSSHLYRQLKNIGLAAGSVTVLAGVAIQNPAVWGLGGIILLHALVAALIVNVEDRRTSANVG